jgi:hypothetical protein
MVADKYLSPLLGLIKCNVISGGSHPRLLSSDPSGAALRGLDESFATETTLAIFCREARRLHRKTA